jgi:hypothetical protein
MDRTSRSAAFVVLIASIAGCQSSPPSNGGASTAAPASARDPVQVYIDNLRDELRKGEAEIYRQVMTPTPQEAAAFTSIYKEYEKELNALNDRRNELIRKFADAFNAGKLDEPTSAQISAEWLEIKARSLDLLKKYSEEISKALSPLQGAQFLQVEHRIATITDLLIAAGIPMLRLEPVKESSPPAKQ